MNRKSTSLYTFQVVRCLIPFSTVPEAQKHHDIMGALQIKPGEYPPGVPAWVITSPLNTVEFVNVLLENAPVLERLNTR